jgi:hypothetical protein
MDDAASYAPQWRDLRRRSLIFWLAYLTMVAGGVTAFQFTPASDLGHLAIIGAGISLLMASVAAGAYRSSFRCPRCGKFFFESRFMHHTFARKCMNCGLPRGAEPGKTK